MNPRKRKLVKTGRLQKIIEDYNKNKKPSESVKEDNTSSFKEEKLLVDEPVVKSENTTKEKAIDPFIAKELEEIKRIPSSKKKATKKKATKKKTTTKKTTAKKKTGGK